MFFDVRNLKKRAPVEARARFLQNSVFRVRWKKHQKIIKKSMDFQVEIFENSFRNCFENSFVFGGRFFWDFERIWDGFWEGLGGHWRSKIELFRAFIAISVKIRILRHLGVLWG